MKNNVTHIYRSFWFYFQGVLALSIFFLSWLLSELKFIAPFENLYVFRSIVLVFVVPSMFFLLFQSVRRDPILSFTEKYIELRTLTTGLRKCTLFWNAIIKCYTDYEGAADGWCNLIFELDLHLLNEEQIHKIKKTGNLKKNIFYFSYMGASEKPGKTAKRINDYLVENHKRLY